ncbi:hypothetical protein HAX54_028570 [Datura stramonium]|uniref:RNase H type-1 domain-containing protein n=1 Tax=Datura stramonium TaxID=4076 RepID=A0ABS8S9P9_DATST|nr:hypothetical protein [Datura stramonium]
MDGAFSAKRGKSGIGGIIRNSNGDWIVGFCNKSYAYNHLMTDLEALEHGHQLVHAQKLLPVEIETDVVEVLQCLDHAHPTYIPVVESFRSLLRKLENPPLRHSFREANKVADILSKQGAKLAGSNQTSVLQLCHDNSINNLKQIKTELLSRK